MSETKTLSPLNWNGKKTNALLDILEIIRKTGATRIWDATTGSGTIPYFLSCQPDLEVFASDLDPILIRFHLSFSQGHFQENLYLQKIQEIKKSSPKETFDELRRLCNEDLAETGSLNPYLYYLFNKLELYSSLKIKSDGSFGGTPKLSREILRVPCPHPQEGYKKITWFEYDYSSGEFPEKALDFDLIILDPPYCGQRGHYDIEDKSQEVDFEILTTSKKIVYFQLDSPYLRFFADREGFHYKIYKLNTKRQKKSRTRKEMLICTHPLAR